MRRLVISLLGNFSVSLDGAPVTDFAYDKVRALLAYLAVEAGRPHGREHLANLLWPDYPDRRARQSLSNALSILRSAIGDRATEPPFLLISHRDLEFNCESDYWLDVTAFTEHYRATQGRANGQPKDPAATLTHLRQADALYQGDFLEGLIIENSVPFEEWALLERESLHRQVLDIFTQLAESALQQGDPQAALQFTSRQVTMDAWRESGHRQMMRALILTGQRTAAIAHYEKLRQTLAADLGVEPETATMELAGMLKSNRHKGKAPASVGQGPYAQDLVGRALGNYLIVEDLSDGGLTNAYKAYHTHLARYVTLKFIRPDLLQPDALRAFEQEAKTLARLDHPNIVQVYDYGELAAGAPQPFLVTAYVAGQTLGEWVTERGPIPLEQAWPILQQVGAALDYAHGLGVIHGDVRTGKVMLTPDGHALLGDFGISKLQPPGGGAAHMAPEQLVPAIDPISPATDVYALGIVAIEMLTGDSPLTDAPRTIERLLQQTEAPSTAPRRHRPDLTDAVAQVLQVLLRAFRKEPSERYPSAGAFLHALGYAAPSAAATATPRSALPPGWWPQLTTDLAPEPGEPPFMGLRHFDVADADRFFGREALTSRMLRQLAPAAADAERAGASSRAPDPKRFLAVVGASGSGKSSLLRAGIVAAINRGHPIPGSEGWTVHLITPSAHPLAALAGSLVPDNGSSTTAAALRDDLASTLTRDHHCLSRHICENAERGTVTLVAIDQFEELFTLCHSVEERVAFINNLLTAAQEDENGQIFVIIALRADFYDHCAEYANLRDALSHRQVYIGPMTPDGLRHAIEEPARQDGWAFEPGLVDLLLRDIGADGVQPPEPGALPLLSHALLATWNRRRGRILTLGGYAQAGGVRGAIAKTADAVYARLAPEQQLLARNLFVRLTELGNSTQDTRRRVTRDEILSDPKTAPAVAEVLDVLADARLITLERTTIQVAHEALIREWPVLHGWLEENREGLLIQQHLTESAQEWERLGCDAGELYRGTRLAQATDWAQAHADAVNPLERNYLAASRDQAERMAQEQEAHRRRELQSAQRLAETEHRRAKERGRMLLGIGAVAAMLFLAAMTAGVLGNRAHLTALDNAALAEENASIAATAVAVSEAEAKQRAAAEVARAAEEVARIEGDKQRAAAETARAEAISQTRVARVNVLTLLSDKLVAEQNDTALLLSTQAYNILDTPLTRSSLLTTLESNPAFAGFLHTHVGSSERLAFSPDGDALAVGGDDGAIQLWDLTIRQAVGDLQTGHHAAIGALAFSPAGEYLASGSCDRVDVDSNCVEGEILLWNLTTGDAQVYPVQHTSYVLQLAFDPTGKLLVSRGIDRIILWDTVTGQAAHTFLDIPETQALSAFALSPDGTTLATGICDVADGKGLEYCVQSDVILWDVASREMQQRIAGPPHPVAGWAFSSDGSLLASTGCEQISLTPEANICERGLVQIWDVATGLATTPPFVGHTNWVSWPSFIHEDTALITTGNDRSIRIWDVATGEPLASPIVDLAGDINVAAVSPDETLLATANTHEPNIRLWDIAKIDQMDPLRTGDVFTQAPSYLLSMAINPEETIVAAGSFSGEIYLWDLKTGDRIGDSLVGHKDWVYSVAFSPDGATLASGSADTTIRLWDVRTGLGILPPLEGHTGTVKSVAFNPAGTLLASGSDDTTMRLWDARTGDLLSSNPAMLMAPTSGLGLWDVDFSPDGTILAGAVALPEKVAILWAIRDPSAPQVLTRLPTEAVGGATQVTFSPDGSILAVGTGLEGTIRLWDVQTLQPIGAPIPAHQRTIWPLAFSPDGALLASGGLDNAIRLIDVGTGQLIGPPLITDSLAPAGQSVGTVHSLVFAGNGKVLFSSNAGGLIHRWDVDPKSWREQACLLAGRNLTRAEWARHLPDMAYEKTCDRWPAEQ